MQPMQVWMILLYMDPTEISNSIKELVTTNHYYYDHGLKLL